MKTYDIIDFVRYAKKQIITGTISATDLDTFKNIATLLMTKADIQLQNDEINYERWNMIQQMLILNLRKLNKLYREN